MTGSPNHTFAFSGDLVFDLSIEGRGSNESMTFFPNYLMNQLPNENIELKVNILTVCELY